MSTNTFFLDAYASLRRELGLIASRELKKFQIGHKQLLMLIYLDANDGATAKDLAEYTLSDPAAVTRAVQSLEHSGWLRKTIDPQDSRRSHIELTAKGKRKAAEVLVIRRSLSERIAQCLNPVELEDATRFLKKIAENLQSQRREVPHANRKNSK